MLEIDVSVLACGAKTPNNEVLKGVIRQDSNDPDTYFLYDTSNFPRVKVGFINMTYLADDKLLVINDMENYKRGESSRYTGVGTLLHEFAFYFAAQQSKPPASIQLCVAHQSHPFHFKQGYRFPDKYANLNDIMSQGLPKEQGPKSLPDTMICDKDVLKEKLATYTNQTPQPRPSF